MTRTIEDYSLKEVMQKIEEVLNQDSKPIEGVNAIYQYDISGEEEGTYQMHLADGKAKVVEGEEVKADCILKLSMQDFRHMMLGKLNGTAAFMSGKLKIKGDIGKAIKMEGILRQYNVKDYL
ncbi:SCP2 sterol-binding domain-containing protein [Peribacillus glennii]|uniref:Sterol-binding protein n=1 Tax=Peribacillus glennii TaxID=2303991 RepID=A0A372LFE9_9BACI|nr:SCP2 sterol-binding domain-containing protein [Peribacillus glennii]RFU64799.1 sterol-binding protein [Peribacillus glennii]